jgi:hypothetical protein
MIDSSIQKQIKSELSAIEQGEDVTILYACESGSRAWGFESVDSDYDVRFIYLRNTEWYLTIEPGRDVIERPISDELDISGWDLPKALGLLKKSNPPLLEWFQSPIIYQEVAHFRERMKPLMEAYYSPIACMYHYLRMAQKNYSKYLEKDLIWTKKYFYVLRPVMACRWIEKGMGIVPIVFEELLSGVIDDAALLKEINHLLTIKKSGAELDQSPRNPIISEYLARELSALDAQLQPMADENGTTLLDNCFRELLVEINGSRW